MCLLYEDVNICSQIIGYLKETEITVSHFLFIFICNWKKNWLEIELERRVHNRNRVHRSRTSRQRAQTQARKVHKELGENPHRFVGQMSWGVEKRQTPAKPELGSVRLFVHLAIEFAFVAGGFEEQCAQTTWIHCRMSRGNRQVTNPYPFWKTLRIYNALLV